MASKSLLYSISSDYNPVLGAIAARLRTQSPPALQDFLIRDGLERGIRQVEIWFRTKGCHLFLNGGCTMCNYGYSDLKSSEDCVDFVKAALSQCQFDAETNLLLSPSGSFLDDWEVPTDTRERILSLVATLPWRLFLFESQANYISVERLNRVKSLLGGRRVQIHMGLESFDPDVRQFSINKDLPWSVFERSRETIKSFGFEVAVNVLIGAPFLSPRAQILDTMRTLEALSSLEVDEIGVFPVNVKIGTVASWLWQHGYYQTPSLWALVHILTNVSQAIREKITFAWHKPYYPSSAASKKVLARPNFGPEGFSEEENTSELLDLFLNDRDIRPLKALADRSVSYRHWCRMLKDPAPRTKTLPSIVNEMIDDTLGQKWKEHHMQAVRDYLVQYERLESMWS